MLESTDVLAPAIERGGDHSYLLLLLDLPSEMTESKKSRFVFKYKLN